MNLRLPSQLPPDQINRPISRDQRLRQAQHIDENRPVEPRPRRVLVDLVKGQEALLAQQLKLPLSLRMLRRRQRPSIKRRNIGNAGDHAVSRVPL